MTEPMTDVDRIRAQWVDDLRAAVAAHKHDKHMLVSPLQVACLFKALDAERSRADAAEAARDAALARAEEGDAEADRWFTRALAAIGKLPADMRGGDIQDAHREIEKLRANALPAPVLMETVEQVEALPRGNYLVQLAGETRTRAFERYGFYPCWITTGEPDDRLDGDFVGALVSGPLPDLPIPTPTQEPGQDRLSRATEEPTDDR